MTRADPAPRLILIRGNSGSGKTTVAHAVRAARPPHTVAVVSQDVLRRQVLHAHDTVDNPAIGLVDTVVRYALGVGRDVVLEGMLRSDRYGAMLRALVADHARDGGLTHAFVYELSFEETLRRHETKGDAGFGETRMREWYQDSDRVPGLDEEPIGPTTSLEQAVELVTAVAWAPR